MAGSSTPCAARGAGPARWRYSPTLAAELRSYAYEQGLERDRRFFPISRERVWQIITAGVCGFASPRGNPRLKLNFFLPMSGEVSGATERSRRASRVREETRVQPANPRLAPSEG